MDKQESLEQSLAREKYDEYRAKQIQILEDEYRWAGKEKEMYLTGLKYFTIITAELAAGAGAILGLYYLMK